MPYQVSWQSVSMKSQRPVHVLASAAPPLRSTRQRPRGSLQRIYRASSWQPPALDVDDPDLENDNYKTVSTLTKNFGSEWRPRHSGFCTPWQTQAIRGQSSGYGAS